MAAMAYLSKECPPSAPQILVGVRHWSRERDAFFHRDQVNPYWVQCILIHRERLHSLEECGELIAALRDDEEVAPQLGQLVGTEISSMQVTEYTIMDRLVYLLAQRQDGLKFDEAAYADTFNVASIPTFAGQNMKW